MFYNLYNLLVSICALCVLNYSARIISFYVKFAGRDTAEPYLQIAPNTSHCKFKGVTFLLIVIEYFISNGTIYGCQSQFLFLFFVLGAGERTSKLYCILAGTLGC